MMGEGTWGKGNDGLEKACARCTPTHSSKGEILLLAIQGEFKAPQIQQVCFQAPQDKAT